MCDGSSRKRARSCTSLLISLHPWAETVSGPTYDRARAFFFLFFFLLSFFSPGLARTSSGVLVLPGGPTATKKNTDEPSDLHRRTPSRDRSPKQLTSGYPHDGSQGAPNSAGGWQAASPPVLRPRPVIPAQLRRVPAGSWPSRTVFREDWRPGGFWFGGRLAAPGLRVRYQTMARRPILRRLSSSALRPLPPCTSGHLSVTSWSTRIHVPPRWREHPAAHHRVQ